MRVHVFVCVGFSPGLQGVRGGKGNWPGCGRGPVSEEQEQREVEEAQGWGGVSQSPLPDPNCLAWGTH